MDFRTPEQWVKHYQQQGVELVINHYLTIYMSDLGGHDVPEAHILGGKYSLCFCHMLLTQPHKMMNILAKILGICKAYHLQMSYD